MYLHALAEAKGAFLLLCSLGLNGAMSVNALVRQLRLGRSAVNNAIDVLEDLDLCVSTREPAFPFRRMVTLTRQGREFLDTRVGDLPAFAWRSSGTDFQVPVNRKRS